MLVGAKKRLHRLLHHTLLSVVFTKQQNQKTLQNHQLYAKQTTKTLFFLLAVLTKQQNQKALQNHHLYAKQTTKTLNFYIDYRRYI